MPIKLRKKNVHWNEQRTQEKKIKKYMGGNAAYEFGDVHRNRL